MKRLLEFDDGVDQLVSLLDDQVLHSGQWVVDPAGLTVDAPHVN